MDLLTLALVVLAGAAALAVAAEAVRRPILFRMAARNAFRRPKQTATVVAGLMIGTAIISSALVAGDSARGAIRGYVYQSLGDVDESVAIPAYPFFPESVYRTFATDARVRSTFDAVAPHVIWQGAAEETAGGLFEPNVAVVGYDPAADAGFGVFETAGGPLDGRGLARGQAIVSEVLAKALEAKPGDTIRLSYTNPIDPLLPRIAFLNGTAGSLDADVPTVPAPLPVPQPVTRPAVENLTVERGVTRIVVALGWRLTPTPALPPTATVTATLRSPSGATYTSAGGYPLWVNVTAAPDAVVEPGTWRLTLTANQPDVPYTGVAVTLAPVYDLALLQERAQALQRQFGSLKDDIEGLTGFSDRHTAEFQVAAVTTGGRGDLFDLRNALFIRLDEAQALFNRTGQVNLVKFSNPGDAEAGEAGGAAAMAALNATLADLRARHPDVPSIQALQPNNLKREFLEAADNTGQTLTNLLVFAGSLSIITGLLLILNIFTMLAEERRSELGMARAIGLGRGDLVRMFLFEGSLYAIAAALLGATLGVGLAYGMIEVMNTIVSQLATDLSFPPITFRPSLGAFLAAASTGALLTTVTILVASLRQSRLNVVRAIRRLEEPEHAGDPLLAAALGWPLFGLGLLLGVVGWLPAAWLPKLVADFRFTLEVLGPTLAGVGAGLALRPRLPRRRLLPLVALALALYYIATYFAIGKYENREETNIVGPVRGVLLTMCVVVLVVHWERATRALGRALGRLPRLRAVAVPAMSYPLHKKFRTGMTLAMFSVVLLSIGFFSIFGALFASDPGRQTGGYDVEARTTLTVPDLAPYDKGLLPEGTVAERVRLSEFRTEQRDFITVEGQQVGTFRDYRHVVYGYDAAFAAGQDFELIERIPEYATDQAAYDGVLARDDQVIVSYIYSTSAQGQALAHGAGDTLEVHLGDEVRNFTIAGVQEQFHYPGIFLPRGVMETMFPAPADVYLYKLGPGADPEATAKLLERNYRDVGMDAKASLAEVLEEQESFRQVLGAMKLFLGLGLLVGVLSLGIITSRSVLERRQEIGMLRALGYTGRQVRRIFFSEVTLTVLVGALVGIACAIVVTFGLWFAIIRERNYPYVIPWAEIGVLVLVSYVVALLATAAPIGRSAKVAPAEALRYVE